MSSLPTTNTFLRKRGEKAKRWQISGLEFPGVQAGDIVWNSAPTGEEFSFMAVFYVNSAGKLVAHKLRYRQLSNGAAVTEIPVCVSDCIADPVDFYSELEYNQHEDGISVIHIRPEHPVIGEVVEERISPDRKIWWNFEFWEYIILAPDFSEPDYLNEFTPDIMLGKIVNGIVIFQYVTICVN